jgi:hypothetical protein
LYDGEGHDDGVGLVLELMVVLVGGGAAAVVVAVLNV